MGASTWTYFAPYHPKPAVALQRLRRQVFASGQYRRPLTPQERVAQARALPTASQAHRQAAANMRAAAEAARRATPSEHGAEDRLQLAAFFREVRITPPDGTTTQKLIAFYEHE